VGAQGAINSEFIASHLFVDGDVIEEKYKRGFRGEVGGRKEKVKG
jgi:hypothetical protein